MDGEHTKLVLPFTNNQVNSIRPHWSGHSCLFWPILSDHSQNRELTSIRLHSYANSVCWAHQERTKATANKAADTYASNVRETREHFYGLIERLRETYQASEMSAVTFDAKRTALLLEMQANLRAEQNLYRLNRAAELAA